MKIIVFELNEVPQRIIDHFSSRPDSNLSRLLRTGRRYQTFAEDRKENLSPWVTWPTVYRGVSNDKHCINHLGQPLDEVDQEYPPIWKLLAKNGTKVGVFGTLHSYPMPKDFSNYSFFVPDTFAAGSECFPEKLTAFQEFNLMMVAQSARNVSMAVPWKSALRFLSNLSELGVKPKTLVDGGKQVASELTNRARKARRRTYQVSLAFDIFMKQLRATRPDFATFFTNHVASSMHRFWAALFPQDYSEFKYDAEWVNTYNHEIEFAMGKFDEMLGALLDFVNADPNYTLWVATSMGQAATTAQPLTIEGIVVDINKFMQAAGIPDAFWDKRPAMSPDVSVRVSDEYLATFEGALKSLAVNGEPLAWTRDGNFFHFGCWCPGGVMSVLFRGNPIDYNSFGMENREIEDAAACNAYHIPQGCLLIYTANRMLAQDGATEISTRDIAPAILKNYGIQPPWYMTTGRI